MRAPKRLNRLVRHLALGVLVAAGLGACAEYPAESESYGYGGGYAGIGVEMGSYPRMVLVPGMPVYYDPYSPYNYFFYDGLYWVYRYDAWYASSWYNGPWSMMSSAYVPYYLWHVPVRYYRAPPPYFHGWHPNEPPRWGEHYGHDWERRHADWDQFEHRPPPPPAPLPTYQQGYSGSRYPHDREQQEQIRRQNYHYEPREEGTRRGYAPSQGQAPYTQPGERQPQTPPPPMPPPPKKKDGQQQYPYQYQQTQPPVQYTPPPSSYPSSQPPGRTYQDQPYQGQPSDEARPPKDGDHHHRAPPPSGDQSAPPSGTSQPSWQQSQRDSAPPPPPPPRYQPVPQYQPAPPPQPTYQQPSSPSTHSSTPPESSSGKGHSKRSAPPGKDDGSGTQPNQ